MSSRPALSIRDHPRGCGEHGLKSKFVTNPGGSSPRMRGARSGSVGRVPLVRIIADAGSTEDVFLLTRSEQDHPRGCGEHVCPEFARDDVMGSSPRMRGARNVINQRVVKLRIIPADAGSTVPNLGDITKIEDHPRGCGEHQNCSNWGV